MDMEQRVTFESIILEAKQYGRNWHRGEYGGLEMRCADGHCVLGSVILGRGLKDKFLEHIKRTSYPNTPEEQFSTHIAPNLIDGMMPLAADAAEVLGIPLDLAVRIANANDDENFNHGSDVTLLDQLLGVASA